MNRFTDDIVDPTTFLSTDYLTTQYNPAWLDMARATDGSGKVLGVWTRVVVKSLVWYNPQRFDDFGYDIPETWDELIELTQQIVDDGGVPWSVSMESGSATGWVGTDWIEDILLRTTSLDNYDAWTVPANPANRLLFNSEEVRQAWELMGQILLNPDYVLGGIDRIIGDSFFDIGVPVAQGDAFMTKMGSFMPPWLGEEILAQIEIAPDGDLWYFVFPPIDAAYGTPVLTSGDVCSAFSDRPEVRAVMEFMTTAESLRPGIENGVFLSPHNDQNLDWYPSDTRGLGDILLTADSFRFDGGDLQPGVVGAGSFWQGVVDYVQGTKDLDSILNDIDASWPN